MTGSTEKKQQRPATEKESYRWQETSQNIRARTGKLSNIIEVCDREADTFEYMNHQIVKGQRFLVRAKEKRKLVGPHHNLTELLETTQGRCCYTIDVKQRGARKARKAQVTLNYQSTTFPISCRAQSLDELKVNVIICQEKESEQEIPLCWILYTTEPINTAQDAQQLLGIIDFVGV